MLLWLSSWLCAACCGDAATAAVMRSRSWQTPRVFERGPHLVAMIGLWACVLSMLCMLTGLLWMTFALVMQSEPAWPNASVWAPVAALPMLCAGVLLAVLLTELAAMMAWRRWCLRNGLRPLPITVATDSQGLPARAQHSRFRHTVSICMRGWPCC